MCPVCFSGADTVTRETLNAGIGVLLGVTAIVLAMLARFFVRLAKRSRAAAHLVNHAVDERHDARSASIDSARDGRAA